MNWNNLIVLFLQLLTTFSLLNSFYQNFSDISLYWHVGNTKIHIHINPNMCTNTLLFTLTYNWQGYCLTCQLKSKGEKLIQNRLNLIFHFLFAKKRNRHAETRGAQFWACVIVWGWEERAKIEMVNSRIFPESSNLTFPCAAGGWTPAVVVLVRASYILFHKSIVKMWSTYAHSASLINSDVILDWKSVKSITVKISHIIKTHMWVIFPISH